MKRDALIMYLEQQVHGIKLVIDELKEGKKVTADWLVDLPIIDSLEEVES